MRTFWTTLVSQQKKKAEWEEEKKLTSCKQNNQLEIKFLCARVSVAVQMTL